MLLRSHPNASDLSPFPIDDAFLHCGRKGKSKVLKCDLLLLSDRVMEAKYQGTISAIEKGKETNPDAQTNKTR